MQKIIRICIFYRIYIYKVSLLCTSTLQQFIRVSKLCLYPYFQFDSLVSCVFCTYFACLAKLYTVLYSVCTFWHVTINCCCLHCSAVVVVAVSLILFHCLFLLLAHLRLKLARKFYVILQPRRKSVS